MKSKMQKIIAVVQILAMMVLVGASKVWAPVCQKQLELVNGKHVHMKCFYTDKVSLILATIIILIAFMTFLAKGEVKKFYLLNLIVSIVLLLTYSHIIGVCMNHAMPCNVTKIWGQASACLVTLTSLVGLFTGKEGQLPS